MSSTRIVKMRPTVLRLAGLLVCIPLAACSLAGGGAGEDPSLAQVTDSESTPAAAEPPITTEEASEDPAPTTAPTAAPSPTAGPTSIPPVASLMEFDRFTSLTDFQYTIEAEVSQLFPDMAFGSDVHAYSPDGSLAAITLADDDGNAVLLIMNAHTTEKVALLPLGSGVSTQLAFTPDGEKLVIGTHPPARVMIWDAATQEVERVLLEAGKHSSGPSLAVSPDGEQVAVVFGEQVSIFELSSGELLRQMPGVSYCCLGSALDRLPKYSQDGSRLAVYTADWGSEITVYDTTSWSPIQVLALPRVRTGEGVVGGSAVTDFSPDGRWIASVEWNAHPPVLIFDVDSGEQVAVLEEPLITIADFWPPVQPGDLAFTPDSRLLFVSGSPPPGEESSLVNRTVGVWDTSTWQRLGSIYSDRDNHRRMLMASDGMSFSALAGNNILIWRPEPAPLTAAREALLRFDAALQAGDYPSAGIEYANSYLISAATSEDAIFGGDPASELETICGLEPNPCPPLRQILLGLYDEEFGACAFMVHFSEPDGSLYIDQNGMAAQVIVIVCDPSVGPYQVVQHSLFDLAFPP